MVAQWLGVCTARGMSLIPSWGAKIEHAMQCSKKKKHTHKNSMGKLVINMLGVGGEQLCIEKRLYLWPQEITVQVGKLILS